MGERKAGKPLSPITEKVRGHLASLSAEALQAMTPKTYRARTHHVACPDAIFQMEKMRAKKLLGIPKRVPAARVAKAPKAATVVKVPLQVPYAGRTFEIIASVDMDAFKEVPLKLLKDFAAAVLKLLKDFAAAVLKQCFGESAGVQLLLLSDPPTLEIRRPRG